MDIGLPGFEHVDDALQQVTTLLARCPGKGIECGASRLDGAIDIGRAAKRYGRENLFVGRIYEFERP